MSDHVDVEEKKRLEEEMRGLIAKIDKLEKTIAAQEAQVDTIEDEKERTGLRNAIAERENPGD